MRHRRLKTIDLCAGIGGIRRGFELTGNYINVLSSEIDPYAAKTYMHLHGDDPTNDLTSSEFKDVVVGTDYDVLLAGFPCQAFSRVGRQLGFRDTTRGTIFFEIADIISRSRPKAVFLENVENLISHDGGNTIERIVDILERELEYRLIGVSLNEDGEYEYSSKSFIRNSRHFGVPQNRPRAYIMGFDKRIYGESIKLLNAVSLPMESERCIYEDVDDILERRVDAHYYLSTGYLQTLKDHKERQLNKGSGFGYYIVNDDKRKPRIANTILATGGSGKERNLVRQHRPGIAGRIVGTKLSEINSEGIRVMTPLEWARLQGFAGYAFMKDGEDLFSFPEGISDTQKYKQLGNSVTIPVIEEMAEFMTDCFRMLDNALAQSVYELTAEGNEITKKDVMEALQISQNEAQQILRKMVSSGALEIVTKGRYSRYRKAKRLKK